MALHNVIKGDEVMVFISPSTGTTAWTMVGHATSHTLSIKHSTRDISNKGTGDYVERGEGRLDVTGTLEGMYIDNDKYDLEDFYTIITTKVPVLMIFGKEASAGVPDTTTTGLTHFYASGEFYLSSVDATFPDKENSTYTVAFEHATGFQMNKLITS